MINQFQVMRSCGNLLEVLFEQEIEIFFVFSGQSFSHVFWPLEKRVEGTD